MPDYSKTIIYKICSNNPDIKEIYVGSTCNFARRKTAHKANCNDETRKIYNLKVYKFIRENGGWNTFDMVPIEKYPCNDKIEKEIRERYWFELLKAKLNTKYPSRTKKEYSKDNAEKIKQYRSDNAEKYKQYRSDNADKLKQYRADNADKLKELQKQYYNDNADKIKAKASAKIVCECGSSVSRRHISTHRKTTKHIEFIQCKTKTAEQ